MHSILSHLKCTSGALAVIAAVTITAPASAQRMGGGMHMGGMGGMHMGGMGGMHMGGMGMFGHNHFFGHDHFFHGHFGHDHNHLFVGFGGPFYGGYYASPYYAYYPPPYPYYYPYQPYAYAHPGYGYY